MTLRAFSHGILVTGFGGVRCVLGKGGVKPADEKREGDGASPLGFWPIRRVLWRADRITRPDSVFQTDPIVEDDGWCDAADHAAYNRPVKLPFDASHERMWRDDHAYDIVVVLGHNDDPVVAGAGSAIFFHLAQPDWRATEGCVAVTETDMRRILAGLEQGAGMEILEG
jgi:L,D-peptidoglycan transpeptidase YkuD (ErfK/YbiS/YcfS/YnhG family)